MSPQYEAVIGLEIHAQLLTKSKIFCGCSTEFGRSPNENTCPVCTGMPGVLPKLNRQVVEYALMAALATNCRINGRSIFARKNYFYPDLPKGYQISQYELPIAEKGWVEIEVGEGEKTYTKRIGLTRIHMEEDAGKSLHDQAAGGSLIDLNRTGVPLIEIVSEPDLRTPEEAGAYLRKLRQILVYLGVCDGNMEEGSFRCDANVSLRPMGQEALGVKAELKNMNSFRFVEKGLDYEIRRQETVLEGGGKVLQETRLFNSDAGTTHSMRGKEEAHDYRYFPDPDLLPLVVDEAWIGEIRGKLPELPDAKIARFTGELGVTADAAARLAAERPLADYFEACLEKAGDAQGAANWVCNELLGRLNAEGKTIAECPVTPANLGALVALVKGGAISGKIAKTVFDEMYASGKDPETIVKEKNLVQISDEGELGRIVDEIIARSPDQVEQYKAGKGKVLGFFVGQVMKATQGKANPQAVNKLVKEKLDQA